MSNIIPSQVDSLGGEKPETDTRLQHSQSVLLDCIGTYLIAVRFN